MAITPLSARSDMVTGGDVPLRIEALEGVDPGTLTIEGNGTDVTSAFRPKTEGGAPGVSQEPQVGVWLTAQEPS